ncbi:MAG TPA: serine hydrolase domain-containing protein [Acetobacteraceae bacterium]|jgi:CubicO group peptidase (beta-lactamase class C family)
MTDLAILRVHRVVDRLLLPWRQGNGPGVTIGVVQDDALTVHRNAGMANIELGVPIDRGTTFRIASVSKQFTCAAVLMLAAEGRLSPDDDLREYIPAFPDMRHHITLDHLMHNTSGIRDMLEIMRLGGVDLGQPCSPQDLLDGVCRQLDLNFPPNTRYLYSNSNFMLLGRIVEHVSGEKLAEFLERRIFAPLGMTMTRHTPGTEELVPGLATGYLPAEKGWRRTRHHFPLHGEGGLVSSVEDLALWHAQFGLPTRAGSAVADALAAMTPFANDTPNTYARGLRIKTWRGVRTIGHDGLWPGFKTSFVRLPDQHAAVICISNDGTSDPHDLAYQVVDALIESRPGVHAVPPLPAWAEGPELSGRFLNRRTGATVEIGRDAQGRVTANTHGVGTWLMPTEDGRLATNRGSGDFTMRLTAEGLEVERDAGVREMLHPVAPGARLPEGLSGRYANPDTAATWIISGAELRLSGPLLQAAGPWEIEPIEGDCIRIQTPLTLYRGWVDTRVLRDAAGRVSGLHVDGGRVKGLVFSRQD